MSGDTVPRKAGSRRQYGCSGYFFNGKARCTSNAIAEEPPHADRLRKRIEDLNRQIDQGLERVFSAPAGIVGSLYAKLDRLRMERDHLHSAAQGIIQLGYAAQRAFRKVRAMLSPAALKYLDKFAAVFHRTLVGASDYSTQGELIDRLVMALEDRRITHITYRLLRATEPTTYDVYQLGMIHHRGSLYLVGWAPRRERVQHWKIDRIEEVELTQLQFQRPAREMVTGIMAGNGTGSEARSSRPARFGHFSVGRFARQTWQSLLHPLPISGDT